MSSPALCVNWQDYYGPCNLYLPSGACTLQAVCAELYTDIMI